MTRPDAHWRHFSYYHMHIQHAQLQALQSHCIAGNRRTMVEVDLFVAGNIGCINQLADADAPFCHIVQLLDYLSGGPVPPSIKALPQLLSAE